MKLPLLLALLTIGCGACASNPRPTLTAAGSVEPDTSGVLRLGAGNHRLAHGCPVSETLALSNAHVFLTAREFARNGSYDDEPMLFVWATRDDAFKGKTGRIQVDRYRDLVWFESTTGPFPHYYPIAQERPAIGSRITYVGFDFRRARNAYAERVLTGVVLRYSLDRIIYRIEEGVPGSSGSCLFDSLGQVIGVNSAYNELESAEAVGIGVSVVGMAVPTVPEVK